MKTLFICGTPFGAAGTAGTYKLVQGISFVSEVLVISPPPGASSVVFDLDVNIHIVNKLNAASLLDSYKEIKNFDPQLVWVLNNPKWWNLVKIVKAFSPKSSIVFDAQSPLLAFGEDRDVIHKNCNVAEWAIDQIFSFSKNSALSWIPGFCGDIVEYPLGIDVENFRKHRRLIRRDDTETAKKYVYIGAVHPKRDIETLINGFLDFAFKHQGNVVLDIYGEGPALDSSIDIVNVRNGGQFINFRGLVSAKNLASELPRYDVGVAWVPARLYNDSPSLKILEYFASGIRVLATSTLAHSRLLQSGYQFCLHPPSREGLVEGLIAESNTTIDVGKNCNLVESRNYSNIIHQDILPKLRQGAVQKPKLKIAIVANELGKGRGGAERVATDLAIELGKRGHSVFLIYEGPREPVYSLSSGVTPLPYKCTDEIRGWLQKLDVDAYFCFYFNRKLVDYYQQVHGLEIPFGMQECTNPYRLINNNWSVDQQVLPVAKWEREVIGAMAVRIRLVMPSYRGSFPPYIQSQVKAFVNPCQYSAKNQDVENKDNIILSINGFKKNKNFILLLKAFASIADEFPHWKLVDIGKRFDPDNQYHEGVLRLISDLGLEDRIILNGPDEFIVAYFNRAKIHVIASLSEGCPTAVLEAMACGVPSVGFADCSGTNELIADRVNGLLVTNEDRVKGLAAALSTLIESPELIESLGVKAREDSKNFDSSMIYDTWESLFYEMASYKGNLNRLLEEQASVDRDKALHAREGIKTLVNSASQDSYWRPSIAMNSES